MSQQCDRLRAEILRITGVLQTMSETLAQYDSALARVEAAHSKIEDALTHLNGSHQARVDRANTIADGLEATADRIEKLATPT